MFQLDPERPYQKKTESHSLIRFQDCDPLQHLNNAKYLDYYFNAREDHVFSMYGFTMDYTFKKHNASWVVYNHQIGYIRPARVSEWVTIITSIIYFDESTMVTEYVMTNENKTELKNVMWSTAKYISVATGKVIPHQEDIHRFLQTVAVEGVDYVNITFNERIKQIKTALAEGRY
ncbi:thioesterase [Siphonobacter sp. BAB-5405]|uniref:acyl-CoA thioesterase n=1 Tax=Siphonobacter sp. BAB-5405 TaxID=1864825 RepID=UPI000C804D2B|nr:acyl-CoA thioesterase [Siphonobacter sp. BAB-5405]PMD96778.1 thioesterase [Siphonobacter sp. BAB-5405]